MNTEYAFTCEFSKKSVLVVGDVMIDRWERCIPVKISQEAPILVLKPMLWEKSENLGGAGNAALNLKAMGADVTLVASVGSDPNAAAVDKMLENNGIAAHLVQQQSCFTTMKIRVVANGQQMVRLDYEDTDIDVNPVIERIKNVTRKKTFDFVFVSDYNKGVVTRHTTETIRDTCIPFHVDPKGHDAKKYCGAKSICPNEQEVSALVTGNEAGLIAKAKVLLKYADVQYVLLTRGDAGLCLTCDNSCMRIPSLHIDVADPTGAGDSTATAFAMAIESGAEPYTAAKFANRAGAAACKRAGVHPVTVNEILSV